MRIAFDLDETLGTPIVVDGRVAGLAVREGAMELLRELGAQHELWLWSVSKRSYLEKVLAYGLGPMFSRVVSWEELPEGWKNVEVLGVDLLVDDSEHHRDTAVKRGIAASRYVVVPTVGGAADLVDSMAWVRTVRDAVGVRAGEMKPAAGREGV